MASHSSSISDTDTHDMDSISTGGASEDPYSTEVYHFDPKLEPPANINRDTQDHTNNYGTTANSTTTHTSTTPSTRSAPDTSHISTHPNAGPSIPQEPQHIPFPGTQKSILKPSRHYTQQGLPFTTVTHRRHNNNSATWATQPSKARHTSHRPSRNVNITQPNSTTRQVEFRQSRTATTANQHQTTYDVTLKQHGHSATDTFNTFLAALHQADTQIVILPGKSSSGATPKAVHQSIQSDKEILEYLQKGYVDSNDIIGGMIHLSSSVAPSHLTDTLSNWTKGPGHWFRENKFGGAKPVQVGWLLHSSNHVCRDDLQQAIDRTLKSITDQPPMINLRYKPIPVPGQPKKSVGAIWIECKTADRVEVSTLMTQLYHPSDIQEDPPLGRTMRFIPNDTTRIDPESRQALAHRQGQSQREERTLIIHGLHPLDQPTDHDDMHTATTLRQLILQIPSERGGELFTSVERVGQVGSAKLCFHHSNQTEARQVADFLEETINTHFPFTAGHTIYTNKTPKQNTHWGNTREAAQEAADAYIDTILDAEGLNRAPSPISSNWSYGQWATSDDEQAQHPNNINAHHAFQAPRKPSAKRIRRSHPTRSTPIHIGGHPSTISTHTHSTATTARQYNDTVHPTYLTAAPTADEDAHIRQPKTGWDTDRTTGQGQITTVPQEVDLTTPSTTTIDSRMTWIQEEVASVQRRTDEMQTAVVDWESKVDARISRVVRQDMQEFGQALTQQFQNMIQESLAQLHQSLQQPLSTNSTTPPHPGPPSGGGQDS